MKKKIFVFVLIILAVLVCAALYLSMDTVDTDRKIEWGVTFSSLFAKQMGLDWQKAYLDILDDLKIKKIRLVAYWPEIESEENKFDFSELDWQIAEAAKRNAEIILVVGQKVPRWPECHIPHWVRGNKELLEYIEMVVNHYKYNPAIWAWQVENEPFLNFGDCPKFEANVLDEEIALVKKLDSRPIIVTDSGELSLWVRAAERADIFGTTMYLRVWHKWFGPLRYPIGPGFFRAKEKITRWFVGQEKPFVVVELQGEPWVSGQLYGVSIDEQISWLRLKELGETIDFAKQTGFSEYYLWGVEWWYFLKQNGHPEYWDFVKNLVTSNR